MSWEKRNSVRILIKNFTDYEVRLHLPDSSHTEAFMGNLSHGGIMLLIPAIAAPPDLRTGTAVSGRVSAQIIREDFEFRGRLVWHKESPIAGKTYRALGIEFDGDVVLSDRIMALAMSLD